MNIPYLVFVSLLSIGLMGKSDPLFDKYAGEKIIYVAQYGDGIIASGGIHCLSKSETLDGKKHYKVNAHGKSIGLVDVVTKIDDRFTSYIEPNSGKPSKFVMHLKEGSVTHRSTTLFSYTKAIETALDQPDSKSYTVPHNVHDLISGFYHVRDLPFDSYQVGSVHITPIFFWGKVIRARFKYLGKSKINTRLGMKEAYLIQPVIPFRSEALANSLRVWISTDANRIPLKAFAKTSKSYISIDLKSYQKK